MCKECTGKGEIMSQVKELRVQMLGGFSMLYGDQQLTFGKNVASKSMQLLQLLLYRKDSGVERKELMDTLYGRSNLSDPSNNLRVSVHRLRKQLIDAGLPKEEYIHIDEGVYCWKSSFPVSIDVLEFQALICQAKEVEDEARINLLHQAVNLYSGDFLPKLSGEDWVVLESVGHKRAYEDALREVLVYQSSKEQYAEMLRLAGIASDLYPFDEWQSYKIEAFMGMGKDEEALRVYNETSKLFFEELGISPSERIENQFKIMSDHMRNIPKLISDIQDGLQEKEEEKGAYYCSFPSFLDEYRVVKRIVERNGDSVYLMLCTLMDSKGNPMQSGKKLDEMSKELRKAIKDSLRKGDSYTQYSANQFLILLIGTKEESCHVVSERISEHLSKVHKHWRNCVEYHISSIIDTKHEESQINFKRKSNE